MGSSINALTNSNRGTPTATNKKKIKGEGGPKKAEVKEQVKLSADEVRQKVAQLKEQKIAPKKDLETKFSSSFPDDPDLALQKSREAQSKFQEQVKDKEESESKEEPAKKSDVGANNPRDPATIGKLKDALSTGAFKFSDKERQALSRILTD